MKVLVHRYNSICEPDYISAFKTLGLEVIEDRAEMERKDIPADERVGTIAELILTHRPLFVFTINFFPYISEICERLGVLYLCVSVDCPVPEIYDPAIRNKNNRVFLFDEFQYELVKNENPGGIFHLPLGAAVERLDETLGRSPGQEMSAKNDPKSGTAAAGGYKYDISLVGSLYNEKDRYADLKLKCRERGYFDGLMAAQGLFGGLELLEESITDNDIKTIKGKASDFSLHSPEDPVLGEALSDRLAVVDSYLGYHMTYLDRTGLLNSLAGALSGVEVHLFTRSDTSSLKDVSCHGGVSSLNEMPFVFRASKINLNPTMRPIRCGLPQRIWDILGCGGFLMTNSQKEITDCFEPGVHLETYDSIPELIDKCAYYLEHDEERERIALAGYEEVKARGSVLTRVTQMIKMSTEGV